MQLKVLNLQISLLFQLILLTLVLLMIMLISIVDMVCLLLWELLVEIEKHLRNLIKNAKRNGCEESFISGVTSSLDAVLMEKKFMEDIRR